MSRPYARYYNYIIFADSETDHKEITDPEQDIKTDYTNKIDFDVTPDKYYYHAETNTYYLTWSYVWYTITIGKHGQQYHYFRTRQQLLKYISKLHGNILIYFHNLSYDFSYLNAGNLLETLGDIKVNCAYSAVKPLTITVNKKIEIRDSLRLFNKSIRELGNELNLPKLEYNYNGERYCNTPLTQKEIEYGFRDVEILYKKFTSDFKTPDYCKKRGYNISNIPLTSTGAIRKDIQSEKFIKPIFKTFSKHKKHCKDINEFLQDINNFNFVYSGYIGGCVYTDFSTLGKIQSDVMSIDLTSSYPSSMIFGYYPTTQPRYITADEFIKTYNRLKNITLDDIVKYGFSMLYNKKGEIKMYRVDIHLKQEAEPNINLRHLSYDALWADVKDNSISFVTQDNEIKSFNMDRVSYFRVHKIRGYGRYEKDGIYYKVFAINVNGDKYYCVGEKYDSDIIYGFKNYKEAEKVFKNAENAAIFWEKCKKGELKNENS